MKTGKARVYVSMSIYRIDVMSNDGCQIAPRLIQVSSQVKLNTFTASMCQVYRHARIGVYASCGCTQMSVRAMASSLMACRRDRKLAKRRHQPDSVLMGIERVVLRAH